MKNQIPWWLAAIVVVVIIASIGIYMNLKVGEGSVGSVTPPKPGGSPPAHPLNAK